MSLERESRCRDLEGRKRMDSKRPSFRELGQLSLPSSFLFKPLSSSKDPNQENLQTRPSKNSCISLSDFLNRKLDKSSVASKTVQSKQKPFSSLVGSKDTTGSVDRLPGVKRGAEVNPLLDESVFEQFKHPRKEKEMCDGSSCEGRFEGSTKTDELDSRKRRNPFRVSSIGDERCSTPRHMVILGDDPKPKHRGRDVSFSRKKKSRPHFNHYANGSGWWDCNMEGVDSEEIGCSEAWEGMGSTTLGGMEWN